MVLKKRLDISGGWNGVGNFIWHLYDVFISTVFMSFHENFV